MGRVTMKRGDVRNLAIQMLSRCTPTLLAAVAAMLMATSSSLGVCGSSGPIRLYQSPGRIGCLRVRPDGQQRYFLIGENSEHRSPVVYGTYEVEWVPRLLQLDAVSGKIAVFGDLTSQSFSYSLSSRFISYARSGRVAVIAMTKEPRVLVVSADGAPRIVDAKGTYALLDPAWDPNSEHLLAVHWYPPDIPAPPAKPSWGTWGLTMLEVPLTGPTSQTDLNIGSAGDLQWKGDGSGFYASGAFPDGSVGVDFVEWPSATRRTLVRYASPVAVGEGSDLWRPMLAEDTGDLVWLAGAKNLQAGAGTEVWRMRPQAKAERTGVSLSETPSGVAISPDGQLLAVVRQDGALIICDLGTGAKKPLSGLVVAKVHDVADLVGIAWALKGRALVVAESHRVSLIHVETTTTR